MYNKGPAPPEISVTVLLLTCSCLWRSASRDLLAIRVSEIFKRSRALRDQRPNRILRWSIYNSYVCFVQTLNNKSCLHIAIRPGQQAVCRYVWEEIQSSCKFAFLLSYRAHWTDAPKFEKTAERNYSEALQHLMVIILKPTNTEAVEGKLFPFNSPTGLINLPTFVELVKRSHSRVYVLQMK